MMGISFILSSFLHNFPFLLIQEVPSLYKLGKGWESGHKLTACAQAFSVAFSYSLLLVTALHLPCQPPFKLTFLLNLPSLFSSAPSHPFEVRAVKHAVCCRLKTQ